MLNRIILSCSIVALSLALAPTRDAAANWNTFQHDPQHTGMTKTAAGPSLPGLKWSYQHPLYDSLGRLLDDPSFTGGLAEGADGTIYAAGSDGRAYAFAPNGTVKFYLNGIENCCSPPVVGPDGTIYYSAGNGFFAIDPVTFQIKWFYADGGNCCGAITISGDGTILIGNGVLHAIDPNNLTYIDPSNPDPLIAKSVNAKWVFQEGGDWSAAVSSDNATIYVNGGPNLFAIDAATGAKKWSQPIVNDLETTPVIDQNGIVYMASDSVLLAIDPSLVPDSPDGNQTPPTQAVRTVLSIPGKQIGFCAYDDTTFGDDGGTLACTVFSFTIDPVSGGKLWNADGGELYAINPTATDSLRWSPQMISGSYGSPEAPKPIIDSTGTIYVGSNDYADDVDYANHLYAFNGNDGTQMFELYTPTTYHSDIRMPIIGENGYIYVLIDGAIKAYAPTADISADLYVTPNPAFTNNAMTFVTTVSNAGPDRAINTTLKLVMSASLANLGTTTQGCHINATNSRIVDCNFGDVAPSANLTVIVTGTAPTTPADLTATVLIKTDSFDPTPGNDIILKVTPVNSACDLLVTAVNVPGFTTLTRGTPYNFTAIVKNQGAGSCATSTLGFYVSADNIITTGDFQIGTASVGSLAPGATQNVTLTTAIPTTVTPGSYFLGAYADYLGVVIETNENNNGKAKIPAITVN